MFVSSAVPASYILAFAIDFTVCVLAVDVPFDEHDESRALARGNPK